MYFIIRHFERTQLSSYSNPISRVREMGCFKAGGREHL